MQFPSYDRPGNGGHAAQRVADANAGYLPACPGMCSMSTLHSCALPVGPSRSVLPITAPAAQAAMKLTQEQRSDIVALYEQCMATVNSAMLQHDAVLAAISGPSPSDDDPGPSPAVVGGSLVSISHLPPIPN